MEIRKRREVTFFNLSYHLYILFLGYNQVNLLAQLTLLVMKKRMSILLGYYRRGGRIQRE
jgi:hypothetical protein